MSEVSLTGNLIKLKKVQSLLYRFVFWNFLFNHVLLSRNPIAWLFDGLKIGLKIGWVHNQTFVCNFEGSDLDWVWHIRLNWMDHVQLSTPIVARNLLWDKYNKTMGTKIGLNLRNYESHQIKFVKSHTIKLFKIGERDASLHGNVQVFF